MAFFSMQGTSLFETLETITAAEASIPVGGKCATLAAQVAHVNFYLEVIEAYILKKDTARWTGVTYGGESIRSRLKNGRHIKDQLKETYQRIISMLQNLEGLE